ncbi:hypothetical protein [Variovorax sp. OV329]|uniref:hypothetical protein n=1 Tax=Variovorax sp. OV329 TaxID=1882825 RepID=UPI0008E879AE|nr:hypothetical protein [Variovorax sp. OV329]SFM73480.1 hypothetical protein SAMN05444747_10867 [Variovorax sp. OV329]
MNTTDDGMILEPGEPDEPISNDALRKALAQAPDRTTLPDWRIRQAILEHARDAISASEELLSASRESTPWWRFGWWRERVGFTGAAPWSAAFATVIVGVLVTLMWQREPVPGARLDERPVAVAPERAAAPAPESVAKEDALRKDAERAAPSRAAESPKPAPSGSSSPVPAPAANAPAPARGASASSGSTEPSARPGSAGAPSVTEPAATASAPAVVAVPAQPPAGAAVQAPMARPPTPLPAPAPAPAAPAAGGALAPAPSSPVVPAAPSPGTGDAPRQSLSQNYASPPHAGTRQSAAPAAADAVAPERRRAEVAAAAPAPAAPADEKKRGAAAARQEPAEPAAPAAPPPLVPDFASLSRWSEMRVANVNGDVRVVPRSEAGELSLLMSSAAIMAVGAPPMRALPEWRVSLERKGQVLAVLEVARSQVRWTEGKLPPSTGTPPIESLDALRAALRQTMRAAATPRPEAPMPPVRAPRAEPAAPVEAPVPAPAPVMIDPPLVPPPVPAPAQ